ncbi:pilus assembly protein [Streptomyces brevispora]|uniref:TadE/TadG family type IV pilus assembly protein n=1 Tax=Streptomyces brevispora TaxID=887462 RepID=UPI002E37DD17|nr:TadE/TadG family type IV pilus assembly protein [Streptomyces brevispora]
MAGNKRRSARDRGQVAFEYMGFIPLLLLVGLCAIQLGIAAYAANQAGTGARAAARTASQDRPELWPEQAGKSAMSDWLTKQGHTTFHHHPGDGTVTYTARVKVPSIIPWMEDAFGYAERSSTMPLD